MTKATEEVQFGYYVVAYLDLLGQQDLLKNMDKLPQSQREEEAFIKTLKKTYGKVEGFRNLFREFYKEFSSVHKKKFCGLPTLEPEFTRFTGHDIKEHMFGDTLIYYSPLARSNKYLGINNIYNIFAAIAPLQLLMLTKGVVFRGGVDVGIAAKFLDKEIYGNAQYKAYKLENEEAQYPRVVIGNSLLEFIERERNLPEDCFEFKFRKHMANFCLKYVHCDYDNKIVINPIAPVFHELLKGKFNEFQAEALCFVRNEIIRFSNEKDEKLLERYKHLENLIK